MAETPHTIAFAHSWSKKLAVEEKRKLERLINELQRDGRSLRKRKTVRPERPRDEDIFQAAEKYPTATEQGAFYDGALWFSNKLADARGEAA